MKTKRTHAPQPARQYILCMLLAALPLVGPAASGAQEGQGSKPAALTIGGDTYERAQVTTNATSITIRHAAGLHTIDYRDLSEAERTQFGYEKARYQAALKARQPPPPPPATPFLAVRKGLIDGLTAPLRVLHVRKLAFLPRTQRTMPYALGLALGLLALFVLIYIAIFIHRKKT